MSTVDPRHLNWHTSTYSANTGNCVEVADLACGVHYVRDTKDRAGGHLAATARQWAAFLSGVKAGRYDQ